MFTLSNHLSVYFQHFLFEHNTIRILLLTSTNWKNYNFADYWKCTSYVRQSKHCIAINPVHTKFLLSQSKRNIKRLTDILTGHCALNKHLFTMGLTTNPNCKRCGELDTAEHLLCHCPAYIRARRKCLGSYIVNYKSIWSCHPRHILNYLNQMNYAIN